MATMLKELIDQAIEEMRQEHPEVNSTDFKEVLIKIFEKNMTPKEAMKFNDSFLESAYAHAYQLFKAGSYDKAIPIAKFLLLLNPLDPRFSMMLAASFHRLKNYEDAFAAYEVASLRDPTNPLPFYYASDCLTHLGNKKGALIALKNTALRIGDDPKDEAIRQKVALAIQALEKEIT